MKMSMIRSSAALLVYISSFAYAEPVSCDKNPDACVLRVIAETATFIDECGKAYPKNKAEFDAAFRDWSVLKLKIPHLEDAMQDKSELRQSMAELIGPYLKRIPSYERDIECSGRLELVRNPTPTLAGDSANLPANILSQYQLRDQESHENTGNAGAAYQPLDVFRTQIPRTPAGRSVQPKFGGYYRCGKVTPKMKTTTGGHEVESYTEYFRFHPDGTVISAWIVTGPTLPPEVAQIADPLDKSHSYIRRGKFAISGRLITFDLRSSVGIVSYHGELGTDQPIFHHRSYINGNTGTTQCAFVALDK
jgi:hypothetical protein